MLEVDSSGVVKATGNLQKFAEQATKTEKETYSLDGIMRQFDMSTVAAGAGVLGLLTAFERASRAMANFSKQAIQSFSHFEQIESGLQGVLKSEEKGTAMFERLRKFSFDTTFGVDTLSAAATQLLNVGTAAGDVETHLLRLGNIAQGDTNKFNELVDIYSKIQSTGKAGSMQLQQLALRGVPVYQYLKKIGVQGKATGDDITKAFAEMTKEGEVFYGTMERINNTVQGKEGFISDTWREFLTSFAEASGVADAYKEILDVVYGLLQGVVDWLQEINGNPVYQAIFRGVLVSSITALTVAVGVGLVGALKKTIAHLTAILALKTAINPAGAIAGIAVGALGIGAGAGLLTYLKNARGEAEVLKSTVESIEDPFAAYDTSNSFISEYVDEMKKVQEQIDTAKAKMETFALDVKNLQGDVDFGAYYLADDLEDANRKLEHQKKIVDILVNRYNTLKGEVDSYANALKEGPKDNSKSFDEALAEINAIDPKSIDAQIQAAEDKIKEYKDFIKNGRTKTITIEEGYYTPGVGYKKTGSYDNTVTENVTAEQLRDFQKGIAEKEKEIAALQKLKNEQFMKDLVEGIPGEAWAKMLYEAFDFNANDIKNGAFLSQYLTDENGDFVLNGKNKIRTKTGTETAIDTYIAKTDKLKERYKEVQSAFGTDLFPDRGKQDAEQMLELFGNLAQQAMFLKKTDSEAFDYEVGEEGLKRIIAEYERYKSLVQYNNYKERAKSLNEELKALGMTTLELQKQKLIEEGFNDAQAERLAMISEEIDKRKQLAEGSYYSNQLSNDKKHAMYDYYESGYNYDNISDYVMGSVGSGALSLINGSDIGNFVQGFQEFGVVGGLLETFGSALMKVLGGMDGVNMILNPITDILTELSPLLKLVLIPVLGLERGLVALLKLFRQIPAVNDFFTSIENSWSKLAEAQETEAERLNAINEQYKSLARAIDEQQQYYLKQRQVLSAQTVYDQLSARSVNDMILTPKGVFSTHPDDTILAMKHPEKLAGNGAVKINVVINNNASDSVTVLAQRQNDADGMQSMVITISKRIANDAATGANGWDNALAYRQKRLAGRSMST